MRQDRFWGGRKEKELLVGWDLEWKEEKNVQIQFPYENIFVINVDHVNLFTLVLFIVIRPSIFWQSVTLLNSFFNLSAVCDEIFESKRENL